MIYSRLQSVVDKPFPGRITRKFSRNLHFFIVYIRLRQIGATSQSFPGPFRFKANNWRETDTPPAMLRDFSDPKQWS